MAALNLLYAVSQYERNSSGLNAVIVDAVDEAAARTAALAALPNGETTVPTTWAYLLLAAVTGTLPASKTVIWIEGEMAGLTDKTRGGAVLPIYT